ncbi:MAG: peptide deformylase [Candidatus Peregrinibacteria bacterium]
MPTLPIQTGSDNPILRRKTKKIEKITKAVTKLIADMRDTLKEKDGLGLAAPQVGQSLKLCLALIGGKVTALINPAITWRSDETSTEEEGCLSLPGLTVAVARPVSIILNFTDEKGALQERKLNGLDARVVQHETDHLEGRLMSDYLPVTQELPAMRQTA